LTASRSPTLELGGLLRPEHRRGGLLDDLLVAALHRAARTPSAHADLPSEITWTSTVAGAGDQALQEHDSGPEKARSASWLVRS